MLAYVDKSYSIEGKMFDTMLFLPYPDLACTGAEWDAYAADLFAPTRSCRPWRILWPA